MHEQQQLTLSPKARTARPKGAGRRRDGNGGRMAKIGGPTWLQYQAAWAHLIQSSRPRLRRSFALKHTRDLKTPI